MRSRTSRHRAQYKDLASITSRRSPPGRPAIAPKAAIPPKMGAGRNFRNVYPVVPGGAMCAGIWIGKMALRAILFDKDGTLVDFQATWGAATYAVMVRMAGGDEAKIAMLAEVSHYDVDRRKILPTSPLVASSSADYGVIWAQILGEIADSAFLQRMDQL